MATPPTRYAVIAEGGHGIDEASLELFDQPEHAVAYADQLNAAAETAAAAVFHRVYSVREISESALWDWGVKPRNRPVVLYVNERAARTCLGDEQLVRRRLGSDRWESVV